MNVDTLRNYTKCILQRFRAFADHRDADFADNKGGLYIDESRAAEIITTSGYWHDVWGFCGGMLREVVHSLV